jgi:hypothetical protein
MNPAILNSRMRVLVLAGLIPLVISLAVAVAVPKPNITLELTLAVVGLGIVVLMSEPRLELTVVILALYLGLLDGPVKLASGGHEAATVFRDVMIFAVSLGAVLRLLAKKEPIRLPPLSGWVVLFVAIVLAEALSPNTHGILKALGGFRQQLEFVPFFFFGYVLMRSKERFRKLFIVLGVIALANGIVSTYQTKLSPGQLASWGPGYSELVFGTQTTGVKGGSAARQYLSEGVAHIRPPGLGKDAGFAGGVGLIALPCTLALLATGGRRKRRVAVLLCLGALLAVVTGLGRLQVVGGVLAMIAFAVLSASAGRRIRRPLMALLGILVLAIPLGAVLVSVESPGTFNRYAEIAPGNAVSSKDKKTSELTKLPHDLSVEPFGFGLATAGAAAGFGGRVTEELEGHGVGTETQYNFVGAELGVPGLVLWVGLLLDLILLSARRLKHIADVELRIDLAGVFAVLISLLIIGISGPVMGSSALGSFFWFTAGIGAYWFLGPGRRAAATSSAATA